MIAILIYLVPHSATQGTDQARRTKVWLALIGVSLILGLGTMWAWLTGWSTVPAPPQLRDHLAQAQACLRINDMEGCTAALDQCQSLITQDPNLVAQFSEYWLMRSEFLKRQGDLEGAIACMKQIPDQDRNASLADWQTGVLELERFRAHAATLALERALARDPDNAPARELLISILGYQLRRQELARQFAILAKTKVLTFKDVFVWNLARDLVWDAAEASEQLRKYLNADPNDRWSRLGLVDNLIILNQLDEAERYLEVLPDEDDEARARRAQIALERGNRTVVATILAQGGADHPVLARMRGKMALLQRRYAEAKAHYLRALATDPDHRETVQGLAQAVRLAGGPPETVDYWRQRAWDHERFSSLMQRVNEPQGSDDRNLLRELGATCEALERWPEARAWYQLILQQQPGSPGVQAALHRVQQKEKEAAQSR